MGLGASVMCTCHARGLTGPPPYAEHVHLEQGFLSLDLPWEDHRAEHDAFDAWRLHACAHDDMELAGAYIANWGGYRMFREALASVGWECFPTLAAVLPHANGGFVEAADSARCLDELAVFEARYRADVAALFYTDTGALLHHHNRAYDGLFLYAGRSSGVEVGVDERGLFVREGEPFHRELFRAKRVEQRPFELDGAEAAELVDLDSGARFTMRTQIHGLAIPWPDGRMENDAHRFRFSVPGHLHVADDTLTAAAFADTLDALRLVFRASVESGNPVRWL